MATSVATPIVQELRERIQRLEGAVARRRAVLSFGVKEIDRRLPEGGLALGALHEVAGGGNGAVDGAAAALFAAGIAARTRGQVLWCVTRKDLCESRSNNPSLKRPICLGARRSKTTAEKVPVVDLAGARDEDSGALRAGSLRRYDRRAQ
jgi:hypothetical protein